MAWMTDEQYEFVSDIRDKSITARSARRTRTHCGKGGAVKFPSDYLSRKELKAMNGECIEYKSLKEPMSWEEFKKLPDDLKVEYVTGIRERFGAPDKYIAEMFGISASTMALWMRDLHCGIGNTGHGNGNKRWEKEKFLAWRTGADENLVEENAVVEPLEAVEAENEVADEVEVSQNNEAVEVDVEACEGSGKASLDDYMSSYRSYVRSCVEKRLHSTPISGSMTFNCKAVDALQVIHSLLGDTNVKLKIEWEVIDRL